MTTEADEGAAPAVGGKMFDLSLNGARNERQGARLGTKMTKLTLEPWARQAVSITD